MLPLCTESRPPNLGKISWRSVICKFGVFYYKNEMQNSINIHLAEIETFTGDDGF